MTISRREFEEMRRDIRRLQQELTKRPLTGGGGGTSKLRMLTIIGGNTLSDGSTLGIKWKNPAPTTVPSLYDPTVDTTFIDGIGRATLTVDGTSQGTVLVAHYSGNGSAYQLALFAGDVIVTSTATVSLPLASDATQSVTLYVPYTP